MTHVIFIVVLYNGKIYEFAIFACKFFCGGGGWWWQAVSLA